MSQLFQSCDLLHSSAYAVSGLEKGTAGSVTNKSRVR